MGFSGYLFTQKTSIMYEWLGSKIGLWIPAANWSEYSKNTYQGVLHQQMYILNILNRQIRFQSQQ